MLEEMLRNGEWENEWHARCFKREYEPEYLQKQFADNVARLPAIIPADLPPRPLTPEEQDILRAYCQNTLEHHAPEVLTVIADFVEFCELLALPEYHVKTASGQYIERQVPSRNYIDMSH